MEVAVKEKIKTGFSIDTRKSKLLFESIFKTINHNSVLPILGDVLVTRSGGEISFSSTDLESIMTISMPDEGKDFGCVFPGVELKYLLKYPIADSLDIALSGNLTKPDISVNTGGLKIDLTSMGVDEYPKLTEVDDSKCFMVDVKEFIPYLEKALLFVSDDYLRPALTGICFKDWKGSLHMVSTDAHRLYWHPICKTPPGFKDCAFILPARSARIIITAFKTERDVIVSRDAHHLQVMCEGKQFVARLIDARYPRFEEIVPESLPLTISIDRDKLASFLRVGQYFTNRSTRQIRFDVFPDKIKGYGADIDFSINLDFELPITSSVDTFVPFTFGVNAKFILQAIELLKDGKVKIVTSMKADKAIIIDDCMLLMPLMLNQ